MQSLTVSHKLGYALGEVGGTLLFSLSSMFLLAYYTDVVQISAAAAGSLFLITRLWDIVVDPLIGTLCDKLFSQRQGEKFRPYLLKGSWPLLLLSVLVFWMPDDLSQVQKLIWAYATYICWSMAYTFINVPYGSLAGAMTQDPLARSALSGSRSVAGLLAPLAVNITMPLLLSIYADDLSQAYLYGVCVLGCLAALSYLLCYRLTVEQVSGPSQPVSKVSLAKTLATLAHNNPFLCVSIAAWLMYTAQITQGCVLYYFLAVNLGGAVWMISLMALIQVCTLLLLVPFVSRLTQRFGVKRLMTTGFCGAAILSALAFVLPTSIPITLIHACLAALFLVLPNTLVWANVAACIEHNQLISGLRNEGIIYSSFSLMRKMGQAMAGFMTGVGLSYIGYDATLALQTSTTLVGIKVIMFLLPSLCFFMAFLLYKWMWNIGPDGVVNAAPEIFVSTRDNL